MMAIHHSLMLFQRESTHLTLSSNWSTPKEYSKQKQKTRWIRTPAEEDCCPRRVLHSCQMLRPPYTISRTGLFMELKLTKELFSPKRNDWITLTYSTIIFKTSVTRRDSLKRLRSLSCKWHEFLGRMRWYSLTIQLSGSLAGRRAASPKLTRRR